MFWQSSGAVGGQSNGVRSCWWYIWWKHQTDAFLMPGVKNAANSAREGNSCGVHQKWGLQVCSKLKCVYTVELHYLELSYMELPAISNSTYFHLNILFSCLFSDILNSCYLKLFGVEITGSSCTRRLDLKEWELYKIEALAYVWIHIGYFALVFAVELEADQVFLRFGFVTSGSHNMTVGWHN